jgi:hypothetical protein
MQTVHFTITGKVLFTDADFKKLWLADPTMQSTWISQLQSHASEAPLIDGRENTIGVRLIVAEPPKELQLVA